MKKKNKKKNRKNKEQVGQGIMTLRLANSFDLNLYCKFIMILNQLELGLSRLGANNLDLIFYIVNSFDLKLIYNINMINPNATFVFCLDRT